jgi:hypothetical protein
LPIFPTGSHLVPQNEDFFDRWVQRATATRNLVRIHIKSPQQGYIPDLDPHQAPASGLKDTFGLVARPGPSGTGEVLMPDIGFDRVDSARLPLATVAPPASTAGNTTIQMLAQFNRTDDDGTRSGDFDKTLLALVGGDDGTAGETELWRLTPSGTPAWQVVPFSKKAGGAGVASTAAHEAAATRDDLSDWAELPAGAPGRSEYSGNIDQPVFVWCNHADRVFIYPVDDGVVADIEDGAYEVLTYGFTADFRAKTVEHFAGRLYFGNTIEAGDHYRQRIRRTALFTADPDPAIPGAGAQDIRELSGDLLRLEKLGNVMVAYFTDGVALVAPSNVATAPDRIDLLRERRGLLSTHAVCSVGDQEHFGIFDDGWFFLDPSGRWTEIGMMDIEGVRTSKWKDDFYSNMDIDKRDRLVVSYDGDFVRIAYPKVGDTDNEEVWIFDPRGNRVFKDRYPVVCWGDMDAQIQDAKQWDDSSFTTWADTNVSWASQAAKFGLRTLHHGTTTGHVLQHNKDLISRYDVAKLNTIMPTFKIEGVLSSLGDPTTLKTITKIWVEYIDIGSGAVYIRVLGDGSDKKAGGTVDFSQDGYPGDVNTAFRTFNITSANLRYILSGSAPILIRSIIVDVILTPMEERMG